MQKVIFENDLDAAFRILNGIEPTVKAFGKVNYYNPNDILTWSDNLKIEKISGIRTFFGLSPNNEIKYDESWQEQILKLELLVSDIEEYKNIAFCTHIIYRKE